MLDEIQTGIGRTGKMFAFEHNQILPDVCTLAKALGNGVPIGACMASGIAAEMLTAGTHGSTFGGNLLSCSAALAVLATLEKEDIVNAAAAKGIAIVQQFSEQLANNPKVVGIRHKGMMIAIDLAEPCPDLTALALDEGLLINVTAGNTIRLLPPLIIDDQQIKHLVDTLSALIKHYTNE
jgi:acetylornithine aminotransferase